MAGIVLQLKNRSDRLKSQIKDFSLAIVSRYFCLFAQADPQYIENRNRRYSGASGPFVVPVAEGCRAIMVGSFNEGGV